MTDGKKLLAIWQREMKILLDTNIVIHREAAVVVNEDIGVLFRWIDNLHYTKCIHPLTVDELARYADSKGQKSIAIKLGNYNVLKTKAPMGEVVSSLSAKFDKSQNDRNDTLVLNEIYSGRADVLITEDKGILRKASILGIFDRVYTIDAFLEKVAVENPDLADYKVLSVKKDHLGNLNLAEDFFASLKEDYPGFEEWFNRKADETVYVCWSGKQPIALLYLKVEGKTEDYSDIEPILPPKKRLKIGSFKVALNGYRLGERFLKIIFDNAVRFGVEEIYVTMFLERIEQQRLFNLFEDFGFVIHGNKGNGDTKESVLVRPFQRTADRVHPKLTYPFLSTAGRVFIVPIWPAYHTELFPDSILKTESPLDFVENEPHRNAISKVYISRSITRDLYPGDTIVFYRTGGKYLSVVSTIGIVESIVDGIQAEADFVNLCKKRSVFSDSELSEWWNHNPKSRPFIVNFLYAYSLPKRINLERLIEMGVISDVNNAPRGFRRITIKNLRDILRESQADESIIVD